MTPVSPRSAIAHFESLTVCWNNWGVGERVKYSIMNGKAIAWLAALIFTREH
jgi:hypothetical protein